MNQKINTTNLKFPIIGVGVVIWKHDEFLLIQRGKEPRYGEWSIPGGRQEIGETLEETALREIREETGLEIRITNFLEVIDSIQRDHAGKISFHATLIDYSAEWVSGAPHPSSDAVDTAWHNLNELDNLPLWSETKRIIKKSAELREHENKKH